MRIFALLMKEMCLSIDHCFVQLTNNVYKEIHHKHFWGKMTREVIYRITVMVRESDNRWQHLTTFLKEMQVCTDGDAATSLTCRSRLTRQPAHNANGFLNNHANTLRKYK